MTFYTSTFPTPFGPFSLAVDADGAVAATAFGGARALRQRLRRVRAVNWRPDAQRTRTARRQFQEYFAGTRPMFTLPLAAPGTEFQRRVWRAVTGIPRGATRSYGELARALRSSARAVGAANAANPACVLVPCHRVIGADGGLTGYAFGTARKRRLLALESAPSSRATKSRA